jgi:hypothetical protein
LARARVSLACGLLALAGCGDAARFVRIPARDAKSPPRQLVLALPQLGRLRARCPPSGRFLVSYTGNPVFDESLKLVSRGKTLHASIGSVFLRFSAPRQSVGREVVKQTPTFELVLDANHEPFEARARVHMRIAESRDGTPSCVTPTLKVTVTTRYH